MSKKMMLLALSVVGAALFALPAIASATPAHIDKAETFEITSTTPTYLEATNGDRVTCAKGLTGHGTFENTTTGSINLVFTGCTTASPFGTLKCSTHPPGTVETISTTTLPFHLITLATHTPGVLITPAAEEHFASFTCGGGLASRKVTGKGVIGTITAPTCGTQSTTATLSFKEGPETGIQQHTKYTGVDYHLFSNGIKAAQNGEGQIHFANPRTISCTPVV